MTKSWITKYGDWEIEIDNGILKGRMQIHSWTMQIDAHVILKHFI